MEVDQLFIKIRDKIPDTHYLIYKQKKYPINFDLFKLSSKYFYDHKNEIKYEQTIQLIDENLEDIIDLTDDVINFFIKYCHREKIPINKNNVIQLNYLAKIYDIKSLFDTTNEYMSNHHLDLAIKILSFFQHDSSFETSSYEDIISDHFIEYLKDDCLLNLNIPIIYRIIYKYQSKSAKNDEKIQNNEIIDFLFKFLDKNGREASILFSFIDFKESRIEYLNLLLTKYSKIFDFHFINYSFVQICYLQQNELYKKEIENSIKQEKIIKEIDQIKENYSQIIEQQNIKIEKLESEIKSQKTTINEIDQKNKNFSQLFDKQNIKIKELESQIKSQKTTTDDINQKNKNFSQLFDVQKIRIADLENQIKKQEKIILETTKANDQLKKDSIILKKDIEDSKLDIKTFAFTKKHELEGIIKYLTEKTGGNIHDNHTIEVTSNSIKSQSNHPKFLLSPKGSYRPKTGEKYFWVCFDFKNMEIKIEKYAIKSFNSVPNIGFLKNWVIEISKDGNSWKIIDKRTDCSDLNESGIIKEFDVEENYFARYCRFRHTDDFWGYAPEYVSGFECIEFFGSLKCPK